MGAARLSRVDLDLIQRTVASLRQANATFGPVGVCPEAGDREPELIETAARDIAARA
jgi:hypothetical protein